VTVPARSRSGPVADRDVARYVRRTVYPYSAYYRRVLDGTGPGGHGDLGRVPPTDLSEVTDPGQLVLRPDLASIVKGGGRVLAARAVIAKAIGGMYAFNHRVIEHQFKPIHWVLTEGVPIGYSPADVQRLASHGAAWLYRSGVGRHDVVVSLLEAGPSVGYWQLVLGCRKAGVSTIHVGPDAEPGLVERLAPSVIAGEPGQVAAVLERATDSGHLLSNLSAVLAVGDPIDAGLRRQLQELSGGAVVVAAWAPDGVRSLWSECRPGSQRSEPTGYHAWPTDVLEVSGREDRNPGELLWTGLGWRGSAVLRLRTRTTATLVPGLCPACGTGGMRVIPLAPIPRDTPATGRPSIGALVAPALGAGAPTDARPGVDDAAFAPPASIPDPAATPAVPVPAVPVAWAPDALLDAEADVAGWQIEYRAVDGSVETIVHIAPSWGAAIVPLVRRLDRHLRATQFVVQSADEVAARVERDNGERVIGAPEAARVP
jgi:hypothetical protein